MKSKKFLLHDTKRIRELGCSLGKSSVLLDPVYTDAFSLLGPGRPLCPVSRKSPKISGPVKPKQNLEPCAYRAVSFICS